MDEVYVYKVHMPSKTREMVVPCIDGYTIYINASLSRIEALEAYIHALGHISRNDFEKSDVQKIETEAHG